jgi:hypothetical protein
MPAPVQQVPKEWVTWRPTEHGSLRTTIKGCNQRRIELERLEAPKWLDVHVDPKTSILVQQPISQDVRSVAR